jgi:hypothetical protein
VEKVSWKKGDRDLHAGKDAVHHILDHGVFPGAIVAMNALSGLPILDGSHRMGAFCGLQLMPDTYFEKLEGSAII